MAQCQSCGDKKQDSELILFDGTPHPNLVDQFKKKLTAPILICLPCYYAIIGLR